jgi:hypothetical protein
MRLTSLLLLSLLGASALRAQQTPAVAAPRDTARDSSDVLVLQHDFTGPGEFARVFLQKGQAYRAELSIIDASLSVDALKGGPPVLVAREEVVNASGGAVYTLYPRADAEYQIKLVEGGPLVTLRLYRDLKQSRRRQKVLASPGWEIGGEIGIGGHSGFLVNSAPEDVEDSDKGGLHLEGCFSARSGPGILNYVSGCAAGVAWDSRPHGAGVTWFFLEPRIRLLGSRPAGVSNTEVGILARLAYGMVAKANRNPSLFAPGIYLSRNVRVNQGGKGFSFTLSYRHMMMGNLGTEDAGFGSSNYPGKHSEQVMFSLGYYSGR